MAWSIEDLPNDVRDLYLFADNDGTLYTRSIKPAYRRLAQMSRDGKYTHDRGVAVFKSVMSEAVDVYRRQIGPKSFSPAVKTKVAAMFADYFESENKLGNMPH